MSDPRGLWLGLMTGTAVLAAGCKGSDDAGAVTSRAGGNTTEAPPAAAVEEGDRALVRVVNAVPAGAVTIWAGDSGAFPRVAYGEATEYREIPDDMVTFSIRAEGPEGEALAENRETLSGGAHYTIVALPAADDPADRNLRVLQDDLEPVDSTKARIRFVNGIPGDAGVELFLRGREDPLFDGVSFTSEAGWSEVEPGSGTLVVRPDGKETTLATLSGVELEGGKRYTFVLSGEPGRAEIIRIEDQVGR